MFRSALLVSALAACAESAGLQKLGLYDYFTDESSPVVYNGALLMFESIVKDSPQWAGNWLPAFVNCTSYLRVREQSTGRVLVNITSSCNHAFGEAFVVTNDAGLDSLLVFGTAWVRAQVEAPGGRLGWGGPCAVGATCSIDAFVSSSPTLEDASWTAAPHVIMPGVSVYNNDVARLGGVGGSGEERRRRAAASAAAAGLPVGSQWVMMLELGGSASRFYVSTSEDPTAPSGWTELDPTAYTVPQFTHPGQIGACPSLRWDPVGQYFYVLTGGDSIYVLRSTNLTTASWQLGRDNGVLIAADVGDCALAAAPFGGWYVPDSVAEGRIAKCLTQPHGFGFDSDVDVTEIVSADGSVSSLFQYGSGDQASFGFSNLALWPGPLFDLLSSSFT